MLALIRDEHNDPPVALGEVSEPEPTADEALIEVHASSLNRGELALLAARPDGWRPGQDIAGVVAQPAASGQGPLLGRRVLVLGAAGEVGHLVVQLAARAGARVTAQVREPARASELIDLGADRLVASDKLEPAAFDAVLDGVGGNRSSGPFTPSAPTARSSFMAPPTRSPPS
jgi:NADPH:quinone reductase-like Zn-dependent oxidoreductase